MSAGSIFIIYEKSEKVGHGKLIRNMDIATGMGVDYHVTLVNVTTKLDDVEIPHSDAIIVDVDDMNLVSLKRLSAKCKRLFIFRDIWNYSLKYPDIENLGGNIRRINFGAHNKSYIPLKLDYLNPPVKNIKRNIKNILLTFGNTDPSNYTALFSKLLRENHPDKDIMIIHTPDLQPYMKWADLAFCSGGTTLVELMTMGVPTVAIGHNDRENRHIWAYAEHQFCWAMKLRGDKVNIHEIPNMDLIASYSNRNQLSLKCHREFKGDGLIKLVNYIKEELL